MNKETEEWILQRVATEHPEINPGEVEFKLHDILSRLKGSLNRPDIPEDFNYPILRLLLTQIKEEGEENGGELIPVKITDNKQSIEFKQPTTGNNTAILWNKLSSLIAVHRKIGW